MDGLPLDVLTSIGLLLAPFDLVALYSTSSTWKRVLSDEGFAVMYTQGLMSRSMIRCCIRRILLAPPMRPTIREVIHVAHFNARTHTKWTERDFKAWWKIQQEQARRTGQSRCFLDYLENPAWRRAWVRAAA